MIDLAQALRALAGEDHKIIMRLKPDPTLKKRGFDNGHPPVGIPISQSDSAIKKQQSRRVQIVDPAARGK